MAEKQTGSCDIERLVEQYSTMVMSGVLLPEGQA